MIKAVLILALCGFTSAVDCHSIATAASEQTIWAGIDEIVQETLETFKIPGGAIGVVVQGQVVFVKGYGIRDREQNLPVTENTLFAIGSCTKAFTTFALGQLVDEGVISWDDPVITHLPEFLLKDPHATHHATLRDLVTHRSGLPKHDFVWYNSDFPRSDLLNRLQHLEYSSDLREKFQYNNLMYGIAGLVIEKITRESWEDTLRARILDPLGMDRSNFSVEDSQLSDDFALPYWENDGLVERVPFRKISNVGPAASINSSASDMVKWLQLQLAEGRFAERDLIAKATLQEIHTLQTPIPAYPDESIYSLGYGLGWTIGIHKGHYCAFHVGGVDGFISNTTLLPRDGIGVVVLSNNSSHGFKFVTAVTNAILDRFIGIPGVIEKAEIGQGGSSDFSTGARDIAKGKNRSEGEKYEEKPTPNQSRFFNHERYKTETNWIDHTKKKYSQGIAATGKPKEEIIHTEQEPPLSVFDQYVGIYENPGYGLVRIYLEGGFLIAEYNQIRFPLQHSNCDLFIGSFTSPLSVFSLNHLPFQFSRLSSGEIFETLIPFEASVAPISFKKKS